jgi:mono/diheme cytochrome c family protein
MAQNSCVKARFSAAPADRIARVSGLVSVARGKAVAAAGLALLCGVIATGCDTQEEANLERGRDLFTQQCATCHALEEARAGAVIGPDLDASFAEARANGMDQDTIEGVVEAQIDNPRDVDESDADYDQLYMPADLVTGSDAEDVAAYIASVAGVEGIEPPPLGSPEELFAGQCGGCHGLDAAGSAGGVGPSLDEVLPGQQAEQICQSIREPQAELSPGFEDSEGVMPQYTQDAIPDEDLQGLIQYLIDSAGGGSGGTDGGVPDEAPGTDEADASEALCEVGSASSGGSATG